jgi:hypothetical protein
LNRLAKATSMGKMSATVLRLVVPVFLATILSVSAQVYKSLTSKQN